MILTSTLAFLIGLYTGYVVSAWVARVNEDEQRFNRDDIIRKRYQVIVNLPRNWGEG